MKIKKSKEEVSYEMYPEKLVMEAHLRPKYGCDKFDINEEERKAFINGTKYSDSFNWVSLENELPNEMENVLLYNSLSRSVDFGYLLCKDEEDLRFYYKSGMRIPFVTHWLKVPPFKI